MNSAMTPEETFRQLCTMIVEKVYESVGTRLGSEEVIRLSSELVAVIPLEFREAEEPVPEMAGEAAEKFFQGHGIIDIDDGTGWRWMN
jgi:hypothetical protein